MRVRSARSVASTLVVALGLALVAGGVSATPAAAWQGPMPVPVTIPGTAYPAVKPSWAPTGNDFNKALSKNPMTYLAGSSKTSLLTKGGTAFVVAAGADVVYGLTVGPITSLTGGSTSGDFSCDFATIFGSDCALGAAAEYAPNADVLLVQPGFVGGIDKYATGTWTFSNPTKVGSVQIDVGVTGPAIGTPGPVTLTISPMRPPISPEWYMSRSWSNCPGAPGTGNAPVGTCAGGGSGSGSVRMDRPEVITFNYPGVGLYGVGVGSNNELNPNYPVVWYPEGHPQRPPEVNPNPERMWETRWRCSDGSTGSAQSAAWTETDTSWQPIPAANCEAGFATFYEVAQLTNGVSPGEVVYTWTAPPELVDWTTSMPPEVAPADEPVILRKGDVSCFDQPDLCTGWYNDPERERVYECVQAGTVLPLSACFQYRPTFDPVYVAQDWVYADPWGNLPTPVPTPAPGPGVPPEVGVDTNGGECFPKGWGVFNPAEWVYKPITCALQWAFVPRAGVVEKALADLQGGLKSHAPFSVIVAIPGIVGSIGDGFNAGCAGMPDFSAIEGLHLRLPCEPPQSAAWRAAYTLQTVILWTTVAIGAWHMVSRSIGGKE